MSKFARWSSEYFLAIGVIGHAHPLNIRTRNSATKQPIQTQNKMPVLPVQTAKNRYAIRRLKKIQTAVCTLFRNTSFDVFDSSFAIMQAVCKVGKTRIIEGRDASH